MDGLEVHHQGFGGKSTFNADISKWDTGKVTNMNQMFYQASAFNQDIGSWNTAQVTDMRSTFNYASAFNHDIGSWNTEKVTTMSWMFQVASAFNQDIGKLEHAQVTRMDYMFYQLLRSTTTFPRGADPRRRRRNLTCFATRLRFKRNFRAPTPSPVHRVRACSSRYGAPTTSRGPRIP